MLSRLFPGFLVLFLFATTALFGIDCNRTKENVGVLFRSNDAGTSYTAVTTNANDPEKSIGDLDVTVIAQHPSDPNVQYVGTRGNGIFRSIDGGTSWTNIIDANVQMNIKANIYDLIIDHENPDIMYAAGFQERHGHLFKSINRGQSWTKSYVIPNIDFAVFTIAIDPTNTSNITIGTAEGAILKSEDWGSTWQLQVQIEQAIVSDIAIDPKNPSTIYAGTFEDGLYKSTDKGQSWTETGKEALQEFFGSRQIANIVIDPSMTQTIYTATKYGITRSNDGGSTWEGLKIIPSETQGVSALAIDPANTNTLYYGSGSIIYKSIDRGANWSVRDLPSEKEVKAIQISPLNSNVLFVGMHEEES